MPFTTADCAASTGHVKYFTKVPTFNFRLFLSENLPSSASFLSPLSFGAILCFCCDYVENLPEAFFSWVLKQAPMLLCPDSKLGIQTVFYFRVHEVDRLPPSVH